MKLFIRSGMCFLVTALTVVFVGFGRADDKPNPKDEPKKPTVMQRKLTHSQKILEGLVMNDFKKIDTGADGLIECVKDATWKINNTDKYLLYSNEFMRRADGLKKAAKENNTDAAALTYAELTLTCVRCHQHLRETRISAIPVAPPPVVAGRR